MAAFAQFGSDLDAATQRLLARGAAPDRAAEAGPVPAAAGRGAGRRRSTPAPTASSTRCRSRDVGRFERELLDALRAERRRSWTRSATSGELDKETEDKLQGAPRRVRQEASPRARREAQRMPSLKDHPHADPQRQVDAEDHQGHEDGRGGQAAPRPGAGRWRRGPTPSAWTTVLADAGAERRGRPARRRCWPAPARTRSTADRRHLRPRPVRRLQQLDRARARAGASARCWPTARRSRCCAVGRKGRDQLRRDFGSLIVETIDRSSASRGSASPTRQQVADARHARCSRPASSTSATLIYNQFKSAMTQIVTVQQLIPPPAPAADAAPAHGGRRDLRVRARRGRASWPTLLPRNLDGPDLPRAAGERGQRARRAHDRDGQRHRATPAT